MTNVTAAAAGLLQTAIPVLTFLAVPELPEVETIRRTLVPRLIGQRIASAVLHRRDIVVAPGDPAGGFSRQRGRGTVLPAPLEPHDLLERCTITDLQRRGKQLAIMARANRSTRALVVQLGMSGQLFIETAAADNRDHVHLEWTLGPARLLFRDPRRFGGVRVFRSPDELEAHWATLGPDALELTADQLAAAARGSDRPIKALLMDQAAVAGIGNIYADEALFRAGIKPTRRATKLSAQDAANLAAAVRAVLAEAVVGRGSTLRDYRDADGREGGYQSSHAVYGRGGEACLRCCGTLRSGLLAQRTTVWCGTCQR